MRRLFDAVHFLRLMSVGEIATWAFLDWKGRVLSKRGVVYETSVSKIESVDGHGKQRQGFYVVSYRNEPCLEMFIFSYVTSVLVCKFLGMERGWGGDQNICHVLFTRDMSKKEPTFNCFYAHLAEKIVTVHTSSSRLVWQIEERAWASTLCVTKFIIFILAHITSSSQDQKQKIILLHYKWGFFKR